MKHLIHDDDQAVTKQDITKRLTEIEVLLKKVDYRKAKYQRKIAVYRFQDNNKQSLVRRALSLIGHKRPILWT